MPRAACVAAGRADEEQHGDDEDEADGRDVPPLFIGRSAERSVNDNSTRYAPLARSDVVTILCIAGCLNGETTTTSARPPQTAAPGAAASD